MALTIANERELPSVNRNIGDPTHQIIADITGDSSYPTNGEAIAASDFGASGQFSKIVGIIPLAITDGADLISGLTYDAENGKIKFFALDDGLEVNNAANLSGLTVRCLVLLW